MSSRRGSLMTSPEKRWPVALGLLTAGVLPQTTARRTAHAGWLAASLVHLVGVLLGIFVIWLLVGWTYAPIGPSSQERRANRLTLRSPLFRGVECRGQFGKLVILSDSDPASDLPVRLAGSFFTPSGCARSPCSGPATMPGITGAGMVEAAQLVGEDG